MSADIVPGQTRFVVPGHIVDETEAFLRERGRADCEAVVIWIGLVIQASVAIVRAAYVPEQTPFAFEDGIGVYISEEAITRLILALDGDDIVLARIHSHPTAAYHSDTDDLNRLISHEGAISIVVPFFARHGLLIEQCSVNEFHLDLGWRELPTSEALERIVIE